jgi:DNA-binding MarR family transcriptional regulator
MSKRSRKELLEEIGNLARAAQVTTDRLDDAACVVMGINRTDHRAIDVLTRVTGPITAGQLAKETGLSPAAMTASIDRLETAGYARRVADKTDRRRTLIEATEAVHKGGWELYGPLAAAFEAAMKDYSIKDLELILDYQERGAKMGAEQLERMEGLAARADRRPPK